MVDVSVMLIVLPGHNVPEILKSAAGFEEINIGLIVSATQPISVIARNATLKVPAVW